MVIRGRIQNGVVVLEKDAAVPEGTEVTVVVRNTPKAPGKEILTRNGSACCRSWIVLPHFRWKAPTRPSAAQTMITCCTESFHSLPPKRPRVTRPSASAPCRNDTTG